MLICVQRMCLRLPGRERVDEVLDQLERKRALLALPAGLADGGARVRRALPLWHAFFVAAAVQLCDISM